MSKARGMDANNEGQGSPGIDTRNDHHSPNSLVALCHCQELSITFSICSVKQDWARSSGAKISCKFGLQRARRQLCGEVGRIGFAEYYSHPLHGPVEVSPQIHQLGSSRQHRSGCSSSPPSSRQLPGTTPFGPFQPIPWHRSGPIC